MIEKKVIEELRSNAFFTEENLPGKRWLAVVAIDNYLPSDSSGQALQIRPLSGAVSDSEAIAEVLRDKYGYELLINPPITNEKADRDGFVALWSALADTDRIKPEDQVIIFFAGHGIADDDGMEGFWIPHVPDTSHYEDDTYWIDHSMVRRKIRKCPACQTLLIADCCYAGGLATRDAKLYSNALKKNKGGIQLITKSKVIAVMTSGGEEPVIDKFGAHSIFCSHLLDLLRNYEGKYLPIDWNTFAPIASAVHDISRKLKKKQTPRLENIQHETSTSSYVPFLLQNMRYSQTTGQQGETEEKEEDNSSSSSRKGMYYVVGGLLLLAGVAGALFYNAMRRPVSGPVRPDLTLTYDVVDATGTSLTKTGMTLQSGEALNVTWRSSEAAYVYIILHSESTQTATLLYPNIYSGYPEEFPASRGELTHPEMPGLPRLDNKPGREELLVCIGKEKLFQEKLGSMPKLGEAEFLFQENHNNSEQYYNEIRETYTVRSNPLSHLDGKSFFRLDSPDGPACGITSLEHTKKQTGT